ncbi:MAG: phytanoyl-CoA dioxygenase family protein [Pseudomonadota bacterium]
MAAGELLGNQMPAFPDARMIDATRANADVGAKGDVVLTAAQVASWRERGFALVDGVFPAAMIDTLADEATAAFPSADSEASTAVTGFGSHGGFVFPASPIFNAITLHPPLLRAIAQLLDLPVTDLRLTQSDLWPKYGRREKLHGAQDGEDQRIHVDYPNHLLTHPTPWERPAAVEMILYLSDFDDCGGPTAVVPREGPSDPLYPWPIVATPGVAGLAYVNDRESAEAYMAAEQPAAADLRSRLYARERYARYRPGTLLLYRHDTWHRGTPMRPGALRLAQNLTYRRADAEWISTLHIGWAWAMYRRDHAMEQLIADASLEQRAVLGFPQPGASYWCSKTVEAVAARFGPFGMDMTPYREAL